MRNRSFSVWTAALCASLLLASACDESTLVPTLCVYTATSATTEDPQCPDPATINSDAGPTQCLASVNADDIIFIRHQLPDGVTPPGPLQLRFQTPCGEWTVEAVHVDGVALWSREAYPGAACSLTVGATIANSELGCTMQAASADSCSNISCPLSPDDPAHAPDAGP